MKCPRLVELYATRAAYPVVGDPSEVYCKTYRVGDGYAVLYIFEWPWQAFPPHLRDYEPVVVFTDRWMRPREVYVDGFHYYVASYRAPPGASKAYLVIDNPWRSMRVVWERPGLVRLRWPREAVLTPGVLHQLRSRRVNPLKISQRIIDDPEAVRGARHWEYVHEPSPAELVRDIAANYGIRLDEPSAPALLARLAAGEVLERAKQLIAAILARAARLRVKKMTYAQAYA